MDTYGREIDDSNVSRLKYKRNFCHIITKYEKLSKLGFDQDEIDMKTLKIFTSGKSKEIKLRKQPFGKSLLATDLRLYSEEGAKEMEKKAMMGDLPPIEETSFWRGAKVEEAGLSGSGLDLGGPEGEGEDAECSDGESISSKSEDEEDEDSDEEEGEEDEEAEDEEEKEEEEQAEDDHDEGLGSRSSSPAESPGEASSEDVFASGGLMGEAYCKNPLVLDACPEGQTGAPNDVGRNSTVEDVPGRRGSDSFQSQALDLTCKRVPEKCGKAMSPRDALQDLPRDHRGIETQVGRRIATTLVPAKWDPDGVSTGRPSLPHALNQTFLLNPVHVSFTPAPMKSPTEDIKIKSEIPTPKHLTGCGVAAGPTKIRNFSANETFTIGPRRDSEASSKPERSRGAEEKDGFKVPLSRRRDRGNVAANETFLLGGNEPGPSVPVGTAHGCGPGPGLGPSMIHQDRPSSQLSEALWTALVERGSIHAECAVPPSSAPGTLGGQKKYPMRDSTNDARVVRTSDLCFPPLTADPRGNPRTDEKPPPAKAYRSYWKVPIETPSIPANVSGVKRALFPESPKTLSPAAELEARSLLFAQARDRFVGLSSAAGPAVQVKVESRPESKRSFPASSKTRAVRENHRPDPPVSAKEGKPFSDSKAVRPDSGRKPSDRTNDAGDVHHRFLTTATAATTTTATTAASYDRSDKRDHVDNPVDRRLLENRNAFALAREMFLSSTKEPAVAEVRAGAPAKFASDPPPTTTTTAAGAKVGGADEAATSRSTAFRVEFVRKSRFTSIKPSSDNVENESRGNEKAVRIPDLPPNVQPVRERSARFESGTPLENRGEERGSRGRGADPDSVLGRSSTPVDAPLPTNRNPGPPPDVRSVSERPKRGLEARVKKASFSLPVVDPNWPGDPQKNAPISSGLDEIEECSLCEDPSDAECAPRRPIKTESSARKKRGGARGRPGRALGRGHAPPVSDDFEEDCLITSCVSLSLAHDPAPKSAKRKKIEPSDDDDDDVYDISNYSDGLYLPRGCDERGRERRNLNRADRRASYRVRARARMNEGGGVGSEDRRRDPPVVLSVYGCRWKRKKLDSKETWV